MFVVIVLWFRRLRVKRLKRSERRKSRSASCALSRRPAPRSWSTITRRFVPFEVDDRCALCSNKWLNCLLHCIVRQWKKAFELQQAGQEIDDETGGQAQQTAEQFVNYITEHRIVVIEDLAAAFHMSASTAIDRIRELEAMGRLTGVMDERGKYVYVTEQEMDQVRRQKCVHCGNFQTCKLGTISKIITSGRGIHM